MPKPETPYEFMHRYPCVTAHIIAESLGYATPSMAATIGFDGLHGNENCCEWIYSCYDRNPLKALQNSIKNRHYHKGFMADYKLARQLVDRAINEGKEPAFASWF